MLNHASKYAIGLVGFSLLGAAIYRGANGDRAGALLLLILAIAAAIVAGGLMSSFGADPTPFVAADAEAASTAVDPTDLPRPSVGPLLAGAGAAIAVAGGAIGAQLVVEGLVLAVAGAVIWLSDAWRTHPSFSSRDAANLDNRLLGPVSLPLVALALTVTIAFSFSRVLLAVSATASWVIALLVASLVLATLWTLAHRGANPRLGASLAAAGFIATLVAGGAGASAGQREFHPESESDIKIARLVAHELKFDKASLELPADSDVEIVFTNRDNGVNHNVALYTSEAPGSPVFNGRPILTGERTYELKTPAPGSYRYICDFHPGTMSGTLTLIKSANDRNGESH